LQTATKARLYDPNAPEPRSVTARNLVGVLLGTIGSALLVAGAAHAAAGPRPQVMDLARQAWECARRSGEVDGPLLTVIDYSLPSTAKRLWVIDMSRRRVLWHELVAHGEGSGEVEAVSFSNRPGSRCSSLGLFRTEDIYRGRHGASLRLEGLEPGVNDNAMDRALVIHGASYVSSRVVEAFGRLGRSWGCPALDRRVSRSIIDRIKGGSAVFAYYPDARWLARSRFLHCGQRLASGDVPTVLP
jgi:hypothetical protein